MRSFLVLLLAPLLAACMSTGQQVAGVCDRYGWESQQCAYAQQQQAAQQAYSRSLMHQGLQGLSSPQAAPEVSRGTMCTQMGMHTICQ